MQKSLVALSIVLFASLMAEAQSNLAIGQWKTYLPYILGQSITQSESKVYYAMPYAILAVDKNDRSYEQISKENALSVIGSSEIQYHKQSQTLIVAYENGIIDLIRENTTTTLTDIFDFDNIPIDKKINHIFPYSDSAVLISANFGLTKLNLDDLTFEFTVFMDNASVFASAVFEGKIYAATTDGLFYIEDNPQLVISDFNQWTQLGPSAGLPDRYASMALTVWKGGLFAGVDSTVVKVENGTAASIFSRRDFTPISLSADGNNMLVTLACDAGCNAKVIKFTSETEYEESTTGCVQKTIEAIEDENGRIWYADMYNHYRSSARLTSGCEFLEVNAPVSINAFEIALVDEKAVFTSGGTVNGFFYSNRIHGFYVFENGEWSAVNITNNNFLKSLNAINFHRIRIHPETGHYYLGTYWEGLFVYNPETEEFQHYQPHNSSLQGAIGDESRERITGLAFDEENNLWISNYAAPEPLSVFKSDGTWKSFGIPNSGNSYSELAIDRNGYKWIVLGSTDNSRGVLVFDEGDMDDDNDDRSWVFHAGNSELTTNRVNCIAVDRDGDVWVGTEEGPVVFECGQDVFEGNCNGSRRKVDQEGIIMYLLDAENILSIEVDGANRKWFGTTNGVFVQSPSGERQILEFKAETHPLLDNTVYDIAINPTNGETYFATGRGICAYRTDAVKGEKFHSPNVLAYPNPVRPDYRGPIAIKGLATDSNVKITDIKGQLIYETTALGGQAIWNGTDYNGRRASSGVYLVYGTSESDFDKPETVVTKILVIH